MRTLLLVRFVFVAFVLASSPRAVSAEVLRIAPVYQQTPVWCWAAVGEMVFRHYRIPSINPAGNFQCGIVALLHPICDMNCMNCPVPAGSLATMDNMLNQYPVYAGQRLGLALDIDTSTARDALSLDELQAEIDAGRPVVAGISPSGYRNAGVSEHVALIVGYEGDDLIVNDPFPFQAAFFAGDPYLRAGGRRIGAGRYRIDYDSFVDDLQWQESIYAIECTGEDCGTRGGRRAAYGRSCRTQAGQCGPFYNQPALPVGSQCYCATPMGPAFGTVVRP